MKDIKCKCSHLKSEHKKNLLKPSYCSQCHCESYLRHTRPNITDLILMIAGFVFIACLVLTTTAKLYELSQIPDIEFSFDKIAILLVLGGLLFGGILMGLYLIIDYFRLKKRRDFNNQ